MNRALITLAALFLFAASLAAQDYVAMVPFGAADNLRADEETFREMLLAELDRRGMPAVTRDFGGILEEAGFQRESGLIDEETMAKIGSATGAKYVVYGAFKQIWGSYVITCSLMEVSGGELTGSGRAGFETTYDSANQAVTELVDQMLRGSPTDDITVINYKNSSFHILNDFGDKAFYTWDAANELCQMLNQLQVGGFDNWRLPTRSELMMMYDQREEIGGFKHTSYWSSTTNDSGHAYLVQFANGDVYSNHHNRSWVRPVRSGAAQGYIAVVPLGATTELRSDEETFREMLRTELDRRGMPAVTRDFGGILEEAGFQRESGLISKETMAKIGSATGAKYVVYGTFKQIWGSYVITCSLMEVSGGELAGSGRASFETTYDSANQAVTEMAAQMLESQGAAEINSSSRTDDIVVINYRNSGFHILKGFVAYGGYTWDEANELCQMLNRLQAGGFDDWRLPTRSELKMMYDRREEIGGFADTEYWSSTESDSGSPQSVNFRNGNVSTRNRDSRSMVCLVRAD